MVRRSRPSIGSRFTRARQHAHSASVAILALSVAACTFQRTSSSLSAGAVSSSTTTSAGAMDEHMAHMTAADRAAPSPGEPAAVSTPAAAQVPVLLVIHIGKPFAVGLADWLSRVLPMPVSEAVDGLPLPLPGSGRVIVAPPDRHLIVQSGRLRLTDGPERSSCRPAIDNLFESIAANLGPRAVGCLLTGMGRDGAEGLLLMRQRGAATVAQDQATSVVFGMPREAIRLGAAEHVLPLPEIGPALVRMTRAPAGSS